jgi:hypothetical protein
MNLYWNFLLMFFSCDYGKIIVCIWEIGQNLMSTCWMKTYFAIPTWLTVLMKVYLQAMFYEYQNLYSFEYY